LHVSTIVCKGGHVSQVRIEGVRFGHLSSIHVKFDRLPHGVKNLIRRSTLLSSCECSSVSVYDSESDFKVGVIQIKKNSTRTFNMKFDWCVVCWSRLRKKSSGIF